MKSNTLLVGFLLCAWPAAAMEKSPIPSVVQPEIAPSSPVVTAGNEKLSPGEFYTLDDSAWEIEHLKAGLYFLGAVPIRLIRKINSIVRYP